MTRTYLYCCLLLMACLLTGCPYQSTVPIESPNIEVPKPLLGNWYKPTDGKSETDKDYLRISARDKYLLTIEKITPKTDEKEENIDSYTGYLSRIGTDLFLNVSPSNDLSKYYIYRIEVNESMFTGWPVTDRITEQFATSAELKAFIEKYKQLSFFYDSKEVYLRTPQK